MNDNLNERRRAGRVMVNAVTSRCLANELGMSPSDAYDVAAGLWDDVDSREALHAAALMIHMLILRLELHGVAQATTLGHLRALTSEET